MTQQQEFEIREWQEEDRSCIFATWLNSYRHGSAFPRRIADRLFFKEHHEVIERLIEKPSVKITIATPIGEPSVILGWACYERGVGNETCGLPAFVHYVYVKPAFRRAGIATQLLSEIDVSNMQYTHDAFVLRLGGIAEKIKKAQFNPYHAMKA